MRWLSLLVRHPSLILMFLVTASSAHAEWHHHHHMGNLGGLASFQNSLAAVQGLNSAITLNYQNPLQENSRAQLQNSLNHVADNIQKFYQDFDKGLMDQGDVSHGQNSLSKMVTEGSTNDNLEFLKDALKDIQPASPGPTAADASPAPPVDTNGARGGTAFPEDKSGQVVNLKDPLSPPATQSLAALGSTRPVPSSPGAGSDVTSSHGNVGFAPSIAVIHDGAVSGAPADKNIVAVSDRKPASDPMSALSPAVGTVAEAAAQGARGESDKNLSGEESLPPTDGDVVEIDGQKLRAFTGRSAPPAVASQVAEGRFGGIHRFRRFRRATQPWSHLSSRLDYEMGIIIGLMVMVPACALFYVWGNRRKAKPSIR